MVKKNINQLNSEHKKELYRKEFEKGVSVFQQIFGEEAEKVVLPFKEEATNLRKNIIRILREKGAIDSDLALEEIDKHLTQNLRKYDYNDGVNGVTKLLYDTDDTYYEAYLDVIRKIRSLFPNRPFYFQKTPTVRIQCPNAENNNHYPRYHTDINYGHPPQEINFWLPLTSKEKDGYGFRLTNLGKTLETLDKFDYDFDKFVDAAVNDKQFNEELNKHSPDVDVEFGEMLIFDSRLLHTGMPMVFNSRVSMDIRIIFLDEYEKMPVVYQGIGRKKILYVQGEAYSSLTSEDL